MAKHNKWSKIKHRKAVVDKRRGKVWTKISKAITVAARQAGPDPAMNLSLRYAMDEARYANMPRETVERAIQKGAGGGDTTNYEQVRYEGYAPGGVAVIVDALTDNRTRTIYLVREAFDKHEGNVGAAGCVAFLFQNRGQVVLSSKTHTDDQVMQIALDAGAIDVQPLGEDDEGARSWLILTEPAGFAAVKDALDKAVLASAPPKIPGKADPQPRLTITDATIGMIPENTVAVEGEPAQQVAALIEALEDIDDVQKVYTNADIDQG